MKANAEIIIQLFQRRKPKRMKKKTKTKYGDVDFDFDDECTEESVNNEVCDDTG